MKKSEKLADRSFVNAAILLPSIDSLEKSGVLTHVESRILEKAVRNNTIKSSDIKPLWEHSVTSVAVAQQIKRLRDRNLLRSTRENGREYEICFDDSQLTRMVLEKMDANGLLPIRVDG